MERMGPGDLRIHFISILPCEIQISIFPICKMGIVIAPGWSRIAKHHMNISYERANPN